MMTAALTPRMPQLSMMPGTVCGGVAMITSSTGSPMSAMDAKDGLPCTSGCFELTGYSEPLKPPSSMFWNTI